jgi:transketolase
VDSIYLAKKIRELSLKMVYDAKASHIGGALSMADLLAVLYTDILNVYPENPNNPERDRFILSKGHACTGMYATLGLCGFFNIDELDSYGKDGSIFLSHTTHHVPGIEISAGSLGHGLPIACGLALAAKRQKKEWKVYCLAGDGEMDEGSNWEALLFAAQFNLDNLCLIIDYNKIQSFGNTNDVMNLEPFNQKLNSFNWQSFEIDGHNHKEIKKILGNFKNNKNDKPFAVIAHTVKGKGIDFMENELLWHYRSPNKEQYEQAINQLGL